MKNVELKTKTCSANLSCFQDIFGLGSSVFHDSLFTIHYSRFSAFIGGDYMASDTLQTYADVNGYGILRHDLIRDTTDLEFDFNQLPFVVQKTAAINGIHIDADHVLTFLQSNKGIMLVTFDRDGQLLSYMRWSGPFPAYLTFDGPVLYSYGYQNTLVRYDTLSHQFLTPRMCPSWGTAGLRIYGPYLYYVDDWRQMIGRVLLDEVKAADF